MSAIVRLILLVWILGGAYLGAAGWARVELDQAIPVLRGPEGGVVCDGLEFGTMEACLRFLREKQIGALFPWVAHIPSLFGLILLGFGFGSIGGSLRTLGEAIHSAGEMLLVRAIDVPLFGGLLGILTLGISYVVPAALTIGENELRPTALLFLALLAGAFSNHVYRWFEGQAAAIFQSREASPNQEETHD